MNIIGTEITLTRGTMVPLIMEVSELGDLTEWTVTFTMRATLTSSGDPICQYTSEDEELSVDEDEVTVDLSETDTWAIPENVEQVYIQLNFSKEDRAVATEIYSLDVAKNLMKVEVSNG